MAEKDSLLMNSCDISMTPGMWLFSVLVELCHSLCLHLDRIRIGSVGRGCTIHMWKCT